MGNKKDITGLIKGDFKAIKFDDSKDKYKYYWVSECINCGNIKSIATKRFFQESPLKCEKCNDTFNQRNNIKGYKEDLSGKIIGNLKIIKFLHSKHSHSYWLCECQLCGNKEIKSIRYLNENKYLMCNNCLKNRTDVFQKKKNKVVIKNDIAIINDKIIIDSKNLDIILEYNKYVSINSSGYPYMKYNNKELFIHRLVVGLPQYYDENTELISEHINGIRTDCRESNLRICQKTLNPINCKIYKNNLSGHKGVSFLKRLNKWQVNITYRNKTYYLGVFESYEDAVKVRENAEKEYFGEYNRNKENIKNGFN